MEFILKNKTLGKENVVPDLPDMTSGITNVLTNYNATVRNVKPVKLQNSHQSRFKSVSVTSHAHYRPDNAITVRKTTKDDSLTCWLMPQVKTHPLLHLTLLPDP